MVQGTPRQTLPATALRVLLERHEAIVTARRADVSPLLTSPPVRRTAAQIVNGSGSLDVYRKAAR